MGHRHYEGDSDLEYTLNMIDIVLGVPVPALAWQAFTFTISHHSWMSHILLYRAWDNIGTANGLSEDVSDFIKYSLSLEPPPAAAVVAGCLLMIGLILGIGIHVDDLSVVDKRCVRSYEAMFVSLTESRKQLFMISTELYRRWSWSHPSLTIPSLRRVTNCSTSSWIRRFHLRSPEMDSRSSHAGWCLQLGQVLTVGRGS